MTANQKLGVPVVVFYSYAHEDEELRERLAEHLTMLRRSGLIREWYDRQILAGGDWKKEISDNLESADLILILISSDFLASDYCYDIEAKRAIERHEKGEAILIPIILRPVKWDLSPFAGIQALPVGAKAITLWDNADLAFENICEGLFALITAHRVEKQIDKAAAETPRSLMDASPASTSDERILDAALPDQVTVGATAVLVVMIRTDDSEGLRRVVEINQQYGVGDEDVVSSGKFTLEFPVNASGKPLPLDFSVRLEAPGFEPSSQSKEITVEPDRDSEPRIFLLTPQKTGSLLVNLEVYDSDQDLVSGCLLRTRSSLEEAISPVANLVSVALNSAPTAAAIQQMQVLPAEPTWDSLDEMSDRTIHSTAEPDPSTRHDLPMSCEPVSPAPAQSYANSTSSPYSPVEWPPVIEQRSAPIPEASGSAMAVPAPPSPRSYKKVAIGLAGGVGALSVLLLVGGIGFVMFLGTMGGGSMPSNTSVNRSHTPAQAPPAVWGDLQTLYEAEIAYASTKGKGRYGTLTQLGRAGLIDETLASGENGAYKFTINLLNAAGKPSFEIIAAPKVTLEDRKTYVIDADGAIVER